MPSVLEAYTAVRRDVERTNAGPDDLAYFKLHERRFQQSARRMLELVPAGGEVLDVGGHYLHLASILSQLGYKVTALDVPVHARLPFVVERASRMGIALESVADTAFPRGEFLGREIDKFDAVMFCEVLEHITFNPVAFWRRVHELARRGGMIYLTTPNSVKLLSVLGAFWNLVLLRRIGLSVKQILRTGTFGHHWKEYSASEIVDYFSRLSPDFRVEVRKISYGPPGPETSRELGGMRTALLRLGNASGFFADNLEAVISVAEKTQWSVLPPSAYP